MEYNPMIPIWLQVATRLKHDMVTGKTAPGDKLPGGRELAAAFTINPNTAARVYQELEKEGLCETRRGLGTFVTDDAGKIRRVREEMAAEALRRFLQEITDLGMTAADAAAMLRQEEETHNA